MQYQTLHNYIALHHYNLLNEKMHQKIVNQDLWPQPNSHLTVEISDIRNLDHHARLVFQT